MLPQTILQILATGCSLTLPAAGFLPQSLLQFAAAARTAGGKLRLTHCNGLLPQTLLQIGACGQGHVELQFEPPEK